MLLKQLLSKCPTLLGAHRKAAAAAIWRCPVRGTNGGSPGSATSGSSGGSEIIPPDDLRQRCPELWHQEVFSCKVDREIPHSPIDIDTSRTVMRSIAPFTFENYDNANVKMVLTNNAHLVKIVFYDGKISLTGGGLVENYKADHVHFHWGKYNERGSEHFRNGESFPMEMHIVHYRSKFLGLPEAEMKPQGIAVLCFLFELSTEDNRALQPIIDQFPEIKKPLTKTVIKLPSLRSLLPGNLSDFYQYTDSSQTKVPTIYWNIFRETVPISEQQLDKFRSLQSVGTDEIFSGKATLGDNFRYTEDIPNLFVFRNFATTPVESKKKGTAIGRAIRRMVRGLKPKK